MDFEAALNLSEEKLPDANQYGMDYIHIPIKKDLEVEVNPTGRRMSPHLPKDRLSNIFIFTYRKRFSDAERFYWEFQNCEY